MKVYHTSYTEIRHPNVRYSRNYLDFGKGFYLTTLTHIAAIYHVILSDLQNLFFRSLIWV